MPEILKVIVIVLKEANDVEVEDLLRFLRSNPRVSEVKVLEYYA